jgi:hypothetical protein
VDFNGRVADRGGRALMAIARFQAESIAGEVESIDLAAAVTQEPIGSRDT